MGQATCFIMSWHLKRCTFLCKSIISATCRLLVSCSNLQLFSHLICPPVHSRLDPAGSLIEKSYLLIMILICIVSKNLFFPKPLKLVCELWENEQCFIGFLLLQFLLWATWGSCSTVLPPCYQRARERGALEKDFKKKSLGSYWKFMTCTSQLLQDTQQV